MVEPEIEIGIDSAMIAKQCVFRPANLSASQWVSFWESISKFDPHENETLRVRLDEALEEKRVLEELVSDLRDELQELSDD